MLSRLTKKIGESVFDVGTRSILDTPPLEKRPGEPYFVSLVCHKDLHRYLIAIKSVYGQFGQGEIVVLDDGTLTPDDRRVLDHQLGKPEYYHIDSVATGPCPSYVCWSRLLLIIDLCAEHYVIQVDSDIVAQDDVTEAREALGKGEAFILVNRQHPGRIRLGDMAGWLRDKGWNQESLQLAAERAFVKLPFADTRYYTRGSAAFVGFPRNVATRQQVEEFSTLVEEQVGPLWRQWGSEQTTTNYVVANADTLTFLEYPRYVNQMPNLDISQAALVHFFGTHRYYGGRYLRSARNAIQAMQASKGGR